MDAALIITTLTLLVIGLQLLVYWFMFRKVSDAGNHKQYPLQETPSVSVVVCARNEAANLMANLPVILGQDYPYFEVVVVDDGSTDGTADVLRNFKKSHPYLTIVSLPNDHEQRDLKGKKFALQKGIEAAHYNTLLLTDADCYPLSRNWIHTMVRQLTGKYQIAIGYSPYQAENSFLNRLIRFEGFYVGLQYLSLALAGYPYMGVGRNLCVDKTLLRQTDPFESHAHLRSGDDDLVVQKLATRTNTTVVLAQESFVVTKAERTFDNWLKQKQRHISTSGYYTWSIKILLGLLGFSQIAIYPLLVLAALFTSVPMLIALCGLALIILKYSVFLNAMKQLHANDLWLGSLLYDFLLSAIYINLGFLEVFKRQKVYWK